MSKPKIGLVGGLGPLSTVDCYIGIMDRIHNDFGMDNYPEIVIDSLNLNDVYSFIDKKMSKFGIEPVVPNAIDRDQIGRIIFPNLENGIIIPEEKKKLIDIIEKYILEYGVDAVLLGCTELPLIIKAEDINVPIISTTEVHIDAIYTKYATSL